jgi:hypothetical protein
MMSPIGVRSHTVSATFAMNATGIATAVIFSNRATWTEIELPILIGNGIPIGFIIP